MLVNNVGHYGGARKAFHEQSDAEWADLYAVNLAHVFTYSRAVLPVLLAQGDGGSIVNVSTIEAFRAIPTRAVYSAFKAAITGFTRSLAVEYARHRVRVNAIAPDVTETPQVPYSRWVGPEDEHLIPTWVPLGRFGQPDDLAGVALFLASRPVGVRDGDDGARRRRDARGRRMVPDRGGRMDESATATLTRPEVAPALVETPARRFWRTYVTDVRDDADRRSVISAAHDA